MVRLLGWNEGGRSEGPSTHASSPRHGGQRRDGRFAKRDSEGQAAKKQPKLRLKERRAPPWQHAQSKRTKSRKGKDNKRQPAVVRTHHQPKGMREIAVYNTRPSSRPGGLLLWGLLGFSLLWGYGRYGERGGCWDWLLPWIVDCSGADVCNVNLHTVTYGHASAIPNRVLEARCTEDCPTSQCACRVNFRYQPPLGCLGARIQSRQSCACLMRAAEPCLPCLRMP